MIKKITNIITNKYSRYRFKSRLIEAFFRKRMVKRMRDKIKSKDFTLISSDCIGGLIYHDLEMPFLSPTINMAIPAHSFVKLCANLKWYLSIEPEIICEKKVIMIIQL